MLLILAMRKKLKRTVSHAQLLKQSGKTVSDMSKATGMTGPGIRLCLSNNRPPLNPHVRKVYCELLGIDP